MKIINLDDMPPEIMLIVEHPSGVLYQNQIGGVVCAKGEIEGVLAPVGLESEHVEEIMKIPYGAGCGINAEIADALDALLAREPSARYLRVDRARLDESWEAWVFVLIESPDEMVSQDLQPYFGAPLGFGSTRGVLIWPNSD